MSSKPRTPPIHQPPIRLAVCVSGSGTTLQNLIDQIREGRLKAQVALVVADRPGIGALSRAEAVGIPTVVIPKRGLDRADFSRQVFESIEAHQADLVILGGFLSLLEIEPSYHQRVLNIHPSLIPAFCGRGYHGEAVHRAAIEAGVKVSGCTVHFADDTYDTGPIVLQSVVPVLDDETPGLLAARVFEAECEALPQVIAAYAAGQIRVDGRHAYLGSQSA